MRFATAILAMPTAVVLCGCPDGKPPPPKAQTEINLWHTFNPEETVTLNRILTRIRRKRPGWRVHPTVIPFARAQNKFRQGAQRCGVAAPHVFRAEMPWVAEFVSKGLIRSVPAPSPSSIAKPTAYLPRARAAAHYRDQRWILPASVDCLALFYNRSMVQKPPDTLEQLVKVAARATVDSNGHNSLASGFDPTRTVRWGIYARADAYWFLPFLWAHDGRLLSTAPAKVFIDAPEAVGALSFYRDLIHRHRVAPPRPSPSNDYEDQMQRFTKGTLAMMVNGPWATSSVLARGVFKEKPGNLGIAPFPSGPSGRPAAPLSGHGWVVSRCAPQPKAAWDLARMLSDAEAQTTFALRNSLLPALEATYDEPRVRTNRFVRGFRAALERSRPRPQHPAIARIFDDFNPAVQAVILGDAAPEKALAGVARAWRRLLGIRQ